MNGVESGGQGYMPCREWNCVARGSFASGDNMARWSFARESVEGLLFFGVCESVLYVVVMVVQMRSTWQKKARGDGN